MNEEIGVAVDSLPEGTPRYSVLNCLAFDNVTATSGGTSDSLPRGTFLKTADDKVYAVSGKALYFSGIAAPTQWTTDYVGAGFVDMGAKTKGSEELTALPRYENYLRCSPSARSSSNTSIRIRS